MLPLQPRVLTASAHSRLAVQLVGLPACAAVASSFINRNDTVMIALIRSQVAAPEVSKLALVIPSCSCLSPAFVSARHSSAVDRVPSFGVEVCRDCRSIRVGNRPSPHPPFQAVKMLMVRPAGSSSAMPVETPWWFNQAPWRREP